MTLSETGAGGPARSGGGRPAMSAEIVLGTAGHVDHGKTALVRALTGRDTDRLAAEKARGISIELGFAPLRLEPARTVSLIDVPGHERFVRHMVAGATGVDGFILCVAADDGVMPQTREHLAVLDLLGISRGVVAVTRSDLAGPARAAAEVAALVAPGTRIVPVCAPEGDGIDLLRAAIAELADVLVPRLREGPTRLWIDRSFTVRGTGTVVTGTLWGADVGTGDEVTVLPAGRAARVRGVQVHDADVERAGGGRVALALAGIGRDHARRGSCLVRAGDGWTPSDRLGVRVTAAGGGGLASGAVVQCILGTHETRGVCILLDARRLEPGESGPAELRLDAAVCGRAGDRVVLRSAAQGTVAGAEVIDVDLPGGLRRRERRERLLTLGGGDPAAILELRAREAAAAGVPVMPAAGDATRVVVVGGRAFAARVIATARAAALATAAAGGGLAATRAATGMPGGPAAALVDALIEEGALRRSGGRLTPAADRFPPPGTEEVAGRLEGAGLRALTAAQLAQASGIGPAGVREALEHLRSDGRAVQLDDLWFGVAALDRAWETARPLLETRPTGIAELRDAWAVGRRHALAIAGHLDARRLTRREGDVRVLRGAARGG